MSQPTPAPEQVETQLRILWAVLLASQGIYAALAASGLGRVADEPAVPALAWAFGAVALAAAAVAHFSWRRAGGAGRAVHEGPPPQRVVFASCLLAWVLDEAIAVCGLVLALLGERASVWGLLSGLGALLMLVHRPRRIA